MSTDNDSSLVNRGHPRASATRSELMALLVDIRDTRMQIAEMLSENAAMQKSLEAIRGSVRWP